MDRPDLARRRCFHPGAGVQPRGCPCIPDQGACKHLRSFSPGVWRAPDRDSAALSSSLQAVKLQEEERKEKLRLQQQEERRRLQEAELRRVEEEKERALGLQRKERELRERLLSILLSKKPDDAHANDELLQPVLDLLHTVSSGCMGPATLHPLTGQPPAGAPSETLAPAEADSAPKSVNGSVVEDAPGNEGQSACCVALEDGSPEKRCPGVPFCIPDSSQQPKGLPTCEQNVSKKDFRSEQDKCNREPSKGRGRAGGDALDEWHKRDRSRARRATSREDGRPRKERRTHKKHAHKDRSSRRRNSSADHARSRRSHSKDRHRRERSRERRGSASRKRSRNRRRSERSRSRSPSRHRSPWPPHGLSCAKTGAAAAPRPLLFLRSPSTPAKPRPFCSHQCPRRLPARRTTPTLSAYLPPPRHAWRFGSTRSLFKTRSDSFNTASPRSVRKTAHTHRCEDGGAAVSPAHVRFPRLLGDLPPRTAEDVHAAQEAAQSRQRTGAADTWHRKDAAPWWFTPDSNFDWEVQFALDAEMWYRHIESRMRKAQVLQDQTQALFFLRCR
ncbi:hypothetical protein P7K49_039796 [Saguinus oedipus]|uniref:Uncharacterized protein n=1 Tax=Saguinus oedipus TaxID=9490 RepID=A0ABQ9TC70_SAGOE|nr:hypothetical protein P7K49_039796 [Saguinus oedipus]